MALIGTLTQLAGIIIFVVGLWMAWPPLGIMAAGLMLATVGLALERRG